MGDPIPVIDVFAGPGGLGEGLSSYRVEGSNAFRIALSVEKDKDAHATLELRSFFRQLGDERRVPDAYYEHLRAEADYGELCRRFPLEAKHAKREAWHAELGTGATPPERVRQRVRQALQREQVWILIGGPPCQAYSIAGRSRNRGVKGYRLEGDERHRLYEEYLRIVSDHWPPVFVMENVRGLLSTTLRGGPLFERMCEDLQDPGRSVGRRRRHRYRILPLGPVGERTLFETESVGSYLVRAEQHGIPQCRHRVFVLGVRDDLGDVIPVPLVRSDPVPAKAVLQGLPRLRSGLSRIRSRLSKGADSPEAWREVICSDAQSRWVDGNNRIENRDSLRELIVSTMERLRVPAAGRGGEFVRGRVSVGYEPGWFIDDRIGGVCNHATRVHMDRDLHRYLFVACFGKVNGKSPRLKDFPPDLLPLHRNVDEALNGGFFNDRFRVQLADQPATTITSHIHKDGHYYIHPDPSQCRSLTVREAARLQTFPDNYLFTGPRTQQYVQVGNAVPPLLARRIAAIVHDLLRQAGLT